MYKTLTHIVFQLNKVETPFIHGFFVRSGDKIGANIYN